MSAESGPGPILLCYDGSESSALAIRTASALSLRGPALACHTWTGLSRAIFRDVLAPPPKPFEETVNELDQIDREAAERCAAEGAELARSVGFDAAPLAVKEELKTWRALVETAVSHRARLTVVGAHGCSGVARALLGSVSSAVLSHSDSPVLVVPDATPEPLERERLLLCYDGSEDARRAIGRAAELFPGHRASVLSLWESWVARAPALAGMGTAYGMEAELDEISEEEAGKKAAEGVGIATEAGLVAEPATSKVLGGPAWRSLIDVADEQEAALIVVGSRGLTGLSAALGSTSQGVVHHSHLPVLVA